MCCTAPLQHSSDDHGSFFRVSEVSDDGVELLYAESVQDELGMRH